MAHVGHGKINIDGSLKECAFELDQEQGAITVKFPRKDHDERFRRDIFKKSYSLEDVEILLPNGRVSGGRIHSLRLVQWSGGTSSVYDSDLVRTFDLYTQEVGLKRLTFKPKNPLVQLPIDPFHQDANSELVYKNNILRLRPKDQIVIFRSKILITAEKGFLLVRSDQSLKRSIGPLTQALSLLQRGRICLVAGLEKKIVTLNFLGQDNPVPAGSMFDEEDLFCSFIRMYVEFYRRLSGSDLRSFHFAIDYLIDGCANLGSIESRAISLYTALEILDNSRTLDKNTIAKMFDIDVNTADLICKVRNSLVHEGLDLSGAIIRKGCEIQERSSCQFSGVNLKASKSKLEHDFFALLMDKLLLHVCRVIGVSMTADRFGTRHP